MTIELEPYIEAWKLRELVLKKEIRPREVAEFFIERIERLNPRYNAFMTVTAERAMADAKRLERMKPADAKKLPLYGVAYSHKDLTWTKGIRTTMGSKCYENFVPDADAEVVIKMREAGGIMLGKTATPEFGARPTTEEGLCPPARNPWNPAHTAGGSSGGAGAAIAAGMNPIAEGSDGGGSIRIPSACCGIVGLKPSRGRVTNAPVTGEGWAGCSTKGPMAGSVRDAAMLLDVMAFPVAGDPYPLPKPARPFVDAVKQRPKKLRLAALGETSLTEIDPEVLKAFDAACRTFREMGHRVERIKLDLSRLREPVQTVVTAGIGSNRVEDPELMEPMVRGLWKAGREIAAPDYINAVVQMHNTAREVVHALMPYDALLTPTLTRPAVRIGTFPDKEHPWVNDRLGREVPEVYTWIAFTFPFNATGQPAFSLPNGFSKNGLPLALQIVGRPRDEAGIIALAAEFERAKPWRGTHPAVE